MSAPLVSEAEFAKIWREESGSPIAVSHRLNIDIRSVYQRRERMARDGIVLETQSVHSPYAFHKWHYARQVELAIKGGSVLICSDAHFWPGDAPPMWLAFVAVAKAIKPAAIILNGDMIDGARISRHPRLPGYSPTVAEEVETLRAHLAMLPATRSRHWTLGNHDARVDSYLATNASELSDYAGSLRDRFTDWPMTWAVVINGTVEVRHRFRGGMHAAWNNALHSGVTMVTGHTHQLGVRAVEDRRGVRYGVECGMIADPHGPQFQYGEGAPSRWRAGFVVLTFDAAGDLMPPEVCQWTDRGPFFRGEIWRNDGAKPRYKVKAGVA